MGAVSIGLVLGVFGVVFRLSHPRSTAESLTPKNFLIPYQEVVWPAADGTDITGWFIAGIRGAPCIIVMHGYEQNMSAVLQLAMLMKESGYNVLLFNLRGHGQSRHQRSSLGLVEADDITHAIDYVMTYLPIDRTRLGIWGVTTGAYAALRAAENDDRIVALALDSVYPTVEAFLNLQSRKTTGIDNVAFAKLVRWIYALYFGVNPSKLDETANFKRIFHIQTLFVSELTSPELSDMTRQLFTSAEGRKEIGTFAKTRNSVLLGSEIQIYDPQILNWFKQVLPL